eukprot:11715512-Heterocapsa_arctica.AAC.2
MVSPRRFDYLPPRAVKGVLSTDRHGSMSRRSPYGRRRPVHTTAQDSVPSAGSGDLFGHPIPQE